MRLNVACFAIIGLIACTPSEPEPDAGSERLEAGSSEFESDPAGDAAEPSLDAGPSTEPSPDAGAADAEVKADTGTTVAPDATGAGAADASQEMEAGDATGQPPSPTGDGAIDGGAETGSPGVDCPAQPRSDGKVCVGSYEAMNPGDLAEIADCQRITGDLVIGTVGLDEVRFEKLERVGSLTVTGPGGAVVFSELVRVDGLLEASELSTMTAPKLSFVGGQLNAFARTLRFACLRHVQDIQAGGETLSFPRLETVEFDLEIVEATQIDMPALRSVGSLNLQGVVDASFPALVSARGVGASRGGRLVASRLGEVESVGLSDYGSVELGVTRLTAETNNLIALDVGTLLLPNLTDAGSWVILRIRDRLSLPVLKAAPRLELGAPSTPGTGGLVAEFPELETVGSLNIVGSDNARLRIASFTAGKLRSAEGIMVRRTSALAELSLPSLESVTATGGGGIFINWNDDLAAFRMPALATTAYLQVGGVRPRICTGEDCTPGNPLLTDFGLGALRQGQVFFLTNAQLPQCKVDALAQQLVQAGLGGTVQSSANSMTCPP